MTENDGFFLDRLFLPPPNKDLKNVNLLEGGITWATLEADERLKEVLSSRDPLTWKCP